MTNYLKMPKKQQVIALLALGWSYRRIEAETGVHRETVAGYDPNRPPKPAKTFPGADPSPPGAVGEAVAADDSNPAKTFAGAPAKPAKNVPRL